MNVPYRSARLVAVVFIVVGGLAVAARGADTAPPLEPLPPGAVEPRGWLRDWAMAARDGITGHLDEYHPTFGEGWKGKPIAVPGV